jgi:hypothetical protein
MITRYNYLPPPPPHLYLESVRNVDTLWTDYLKTGIHTGLPHNLIPPSFSRTAFLTPRPPPVDSYIPTPPSKPGEAPM